VKKNSIVKGIYLLKKRASFSNFKNGIDEEKIYGPICLIILFLYGLFLFFGIIDLTIFIVASLLILWNFFVYFPFHKRPITLLTFILVLVPLIVGGAYLLIIKKVIFSNIRYISYFWFFSITMAFIIEFFACKKHSLEEVDIFLGYCKRKIGFWIVPILIPLSSIVFLAFVSTYYIFGKNHFYAWIPIFIFWIISGIRLIKYRVLT
jgi:hypothetical protein